MSQILEYSYYHFPYLIDTNFNISKWSKFREFICELLYIVQII